MALPGLNTPDGSGQIWLDNVGCGGNEIGLGDCPSNGVGIHNCHHSKDAGVECIPGMTVNQEFAVKSPYHSIIIDFVHKCCSQMQAQFSCTK